MDRDLLRANFENFVQLTEKEWQLAASLLTERRFARGAFLTTEGSINRYTNFITSGSVRVYYIDPAGQEHVVQLGIRGWWTGDFPSFITQEAGLLYSEALEATETLSFSYMHLQQLYTEAPVFERFFRLLVQKAYASFQYRLLHNISLDAEQRYRAFRDRYPELDASIPQKHIASYLGMSAEFLSKIKKRVHQSRTSTR
ncbi:MAG: Crp/Fnr family transcriptional regulator [Chitinophagaceae bacterium]|nr:MAG: Crp/Fnr family transcriptional regulator [Chitinophagaceae bacterium]